MKCLDLHKHFKEIGSWVDWERTTDTFKAGDPQKPVQKAAVAWKASWDALKEAVRRGADLFISHESICVRAVNGSPDPEVNFALPSEIPKFEWLEQTGLVVYRCHDVWDQYPEIGIRASWQKGLGLGDRIIADEHRIFVTQIEPMTLGDLADHILRRIRPLGQNGVLVAGDPQRSIEKVATGMGVTTNPVQMLELGADVGVITDDYYLFVRMGVHAEELGFPTISVNHAVTEQWGISNLSSYIENTLPDLDVFHIPQACPYTVITDQK